jgi:hypothetical protein
LYGAAVRHCHHREGTKWWLDLMRRMSRNVMLSYLYGEVHWWPDESGDERLPAFNFVIGNLTRSEQSPNKIVACCELHSVVRRAPHFFYPAG